MSNACVDAVSQGLVDGGIKAAYNFPGFYSHEIAEKVGCTTMSIDERVAYAEAYGSCLAGTRSVVSFKNVGLSIASDAFLHSIIGGVSAGLVVVVTDDIDVWGSQESQDSRHYFEFFGGLWIEPTDIQHSYDTAYEAAVLSEKYDVPVVIRLTNDLFASHGGVLRKKPLETSAPTRKHLPSRTVVHPVYHKTQQERLDEKNARIREYVEERVSLPRVSSSDGIVTFGAAEARTLPAQGDTLRVSTLPLPEKALRQFMSQHDAIDILECGQPIIRNKLVLTNPETTVRSLERQQKGEPVEFTKWDRYENFFSALNVVKEHDYVSGDITQFTVETYNTVDVALSLGVAVSTAIGISDQLGFAYAISGDCSFSHEGSSIIREALQRGVNICIIIIDNGVSWCTGGQPCVTPLKLNELPEAVRYEWQEYDSCTEEEFIAILSSLRNHTGVSVLHIGVPVGSFNR